MQSLGPQQARITLGKVILDVFWGAKVFQSKTKEQVPRRGQKVHRRMMLQVICSDGIPFLLPQLKKGQHFLIELANILIEQAKHRLHWNWHEVGGLSSCPSPTAIGSSSKAIKKMNVGL